MEITTLTTPAYRDETEYARPVAQTNRIQTLDLLRGVALLGILLMNIPGFGFGPAALADANLYEVSQQGTGADFYTWATVRIQFLGTMRGLFSILFGAGMLLFTLNKTDTPDGATVAEYYYRRLLWLMLFGMVNAYILLWWGDILFQYGLCGLVLFPFRRAKPIWLVSLAVLCLGFNLIRPGLQYSEVRANRAGYLDVIRLEKAHQKPTIDQLAAKVAWEEYARPFQKDIRKITEEVKAVRGGYRTMFAYLIPINSHYESEYIYLNSWDCLLMMFLGMALLKWGFLSNKLPTSTYAMTLLIGYGLGLPLSWVWLQGMIEKSAPDATLFVDHYRVSTGLLYDVRRVLVALGHASLILLVYRANVLPWLMRALTAVGQMAFTNYLMQSIICALFFYGFGFGYFGKLAFHELYYVVAGVWVFQLIVSPIWLRYFRFGPFEWLWRSLTYWQRQPMRRTATVD